MVEEEEDQILMTDVSVILIHPLGVSFPSNLGLISETVTVTQVFIRYASVFMNNHDL